MAHFYAKIIFFAAEIFICILIATQVFAGTDAESDRETKQEVVVVIAGGFGSCPDDLIFDRAIRAGKTADMHRLFAIYVLPVLKRKQFADRPTIFSLCYSGPDSLASSFTQSISGRYAWNRDDLKRNAEGVKTFSVSQGKSLNDLQFLEPVTIELKNYL